MKLDRMLGIALTAALACGCSSSMTSGTRTASASTGSLSAEQASTPGTTNLMSARMAGPAPKVGKAHLAGDESETGAANDIESGSTTQSDDAPAPKGARPSDGSRRGGGFGSSK